MRIILSGDENDKEFFLQNQGNIQEFFSIGQVQGVPCMTGDSNWDIIVIGGGLGGLTSAAYLAKAGKSVLLLEQQDRPGGCCGTYPSDGKTIPPAVHMVNDPDLINGILRELGAAEVRFTPFNPVFEVTGPHPGNKLIISSDREIFEESALGLAMDAPPEKVRLGIGRLIELSRGDSSRNQGFAAGEPGTDVIFQTCNPWPHHAA